MTNLDNELNFNELDTIVGGTGAFGGALTYVKAYVAALGTVTTKNIGSIYEGTGTGSGGVNDTGSGGGSGSGGCPGGCHGIT
jgi:hypothetical protein